MVLVDVINVDLVYLLLALNIFHNFFRGFQFLTLYR